MTILAMMLLILRGAPSSLRRTRAIGIITRSSTPPPPTPIAPSTTLPFPIRAQAVHRVVAATTAPGPSPPIRQAAAVHRAVRHHQADLVQTPIAAVVHPPLHHQEGQDRIRKARHPRHRQMVPTEAAVVATPPPLYRLPAHPPRRPMGRDHIPLVAAVLHQVHLRQAHRVHTATPPLRITITMGGIVTSGHLAVGAAHLPVTAALLEPISRVARPSLASHTWAATDSMTVAIGTIIGGCGMSLGTSAGATLGTIGSGSWIGTRSTLRSPRIGPN